MSSEHDGERIRICVEKLTLAVRSDPAQAEQLVREIESIAAANTEPLFEAYSQRAQGHLFGIRGDMVKAVQRYRSALEIFDRCNEGVEKARTASTLVGALVPLGEFDEALRLANEARQSFQQANLPNRAARLDVNVGNLYHRLNRLDEALFHYQRGAALLEDSEDYEAAAGVMINRSVVLMLLYRFDEALQGLLRARAFSEKHGLKVFVTQSEYNQAYLLFLAGDYVQALRMLQAAEAGFRELGDEIHVAHCRSDRAEILLELNLPGYSLESAKLAESGFRASGLSVDRSRVLLLLGRCLMRLGQNDEANVHYFEARHLFQGDGNALWVRMADLGIASAYMTAGRLQEAADLALQTAEFFRVQKHVPFAAVADTLAARMLIELRESGYALSLLNKCEESLQSQLPASLRYDIQYLKGRAFEQQGKRAEARGFFESAIESLEFLLNHISVEHAMVRFLAEKEDVYERLAGLTEDANTAFELVDRARTRALSQFWNVREPLLGSSESALQLRERLRSDYRKLFQMQQVQPLQVFENIQRTERQLMHELLDAEFRLAQAAPGPAGPVGLNLSPDETLLEYFISDDLVSVFVISGGGIERVVLPISTAELQDEINLTRYGLSSAGHPQRESALRFHLQRLYKVLLEPVAPLLTHRIVIVPHRCLHDFPFHVLLEPDGRYLAEHYVTTYAPSASAYVLASQRETSSSGRSLIIGADGPDLPAVQSEIGAVAHELPGCKIAMNSSLQEIRRELETASFIHVASHALFRSDDPAWSVLNLGGDVLAPADLMGLKVNADLVTLSACSTGRANSRRNEASGFVRAFSLWGVPTLIASLWEVNDNATSQVMCNFYEGFRRSPDIAENLRQAMLRVKAQFAHPCYWGGFVLIGRQKLGESWNWFNGGGYEARKQPVN